MTVRTFPERRRAPAQGAGGNYPAASRKGAATAMYGMSPFEIAGTAPELRLTEIDQTDPAGRWRLVAQNGALYLELSSAANWANAPGANDTLLSSDGLTSETITLGNAGDGTKLSLLTGNVANANMAELRVESSTSPQIVMKLLNTTRLTLSDPLIGSPLLSLAGTEMTMQGEELRGLLSLRGYGTAALTIRSHSALTDATARRTAMYVLDPATDTEYIVANAVPDGANPKFTLAAPDDTPSTAELDADHVTFSYVKATDTLSVHINEAGSVKTLALGVMV